MRSLNAVFADLDYMLLIELRCRRLARRAVECFRIWLAGTQARKEI
jgi:hypothetical protein